MVFLNYYKAHSPTGKVLEGKCGSGSMGHVDLERVDTQQYKSFGTFGKKAFKTVSHPIKFGNLSSFLLILKNLIMIISSLKML
jgi:hypothetical protein